MVGTAISVLSHYITILDVCHIFRVIIQVVAAKTMNNLNVLNQKKVPNS